MSLYGNEFTIHLAMRFKSSGRRIIETTVGDQSNQTTGWRSVASGTSLKATPRRSPSSLRCGGTTARGNQSQVEW